MQSLVVEYPFEITLNTYIDSLHNQNYRLNETDKGFEIIDFKNESKRYYFNGTNS